MNLRIIQNLLVVACFLMPLNSAGQDSVPEQRLLTVDDYAKFKSVGSPVFSEDGLWLAYTVETGDYEQNQSLTRIWMQPALGGTPIALTAAAV